MSFSVCFVLDLVVIVVVVVVFVLTDPEGNIRKK